MSPAARASPGGAAWLVLEKVSLAFLAIVFLALLASYLLLAYLAVQENKAIKKRAALEAELARTNPELAKQMEANDEEDRQTAARLEEEALAANVATAALTRRS